MAVIDKKMYTELNKWRHKAKYRFLKYINRSDRALTDATIRKLMYEIDKKDVHGDCYVSLFSAKNFSRTMREYFSGLAKLHFLTPDDKDSIIEIINSIPTVLGLGWITLIIEDLEELSDQPEKMEELISAVIRFAARGANVILVGDGDYKKVFSSCEVALSDIEDGLKAREDGKYLMIGLYEQSENPKVETIIFEDEKAERKELIFYWETLYEQLEYKYFDYEFFKSLCRETWEYLIPRVSSDCVYRQDIELIELIGRFKMPEDKDIDGCKPWEMEVAVQFAEGLNDALMNTYEKNSDFSTGGIGMVVIIEEREEHYGCLHVSSSLQSHKNFYPHTLSAQLDHLAEAIHKSAYEGNCIAAMDWLDAVNEIADSAINKEPERKVRGHKQ